MYMEAGEMAKKKKKLLKKAREMVRKRIGG